MQTSAVVLDAPRALALRPVAMRDPGPADVVVETAWTGVSAGTEKLLWSGRMPDFPGMGYPLVPGYETFGEVVEAGADSGRRVGDSVFVPGASGYEDVRGLFGGAAERLIVPGAKAIPMDAGLKAQGALMALAATARHAIAAPRAPLPELIVGHGALGRLLARLTVAAGGAPTVWEIDPARRAGDFGYQVVDPEADPRRDYAAIADVSGAPDLLDGLVARLAPGGEICLAGFYAAPLSFAFPPAFMKEARLRVAAEWTPADMEATRLLVDAGVLSLDGLITHERPAAEAAAAYATAFDDPACLKMILDWKGAA
jgi:3-hydroxyethyl bacteriochlorophyllide a dehydrogenase